MDEIPWFEYDENDLDTTQRAFVDVLAEHANSWQVDPLDTVVLPSAHTVNGQLVVYLDIGEPQRNQGVLTVGAHFDGSLVRGANYITRTSPSKRPRASKPQASLPSWRTERQSGSR
ncbi:hypothetical protein [Nocardia sp. NPDC050710]|uniref:hypothetical protein n=1 Tax=Nocardia sp. NPDC050710 TaxID=3157220 RepID=UPI0033C39893